MYNKYSITVLSFFFLILLFPFLGIFSKINYNIEEILIFLKNSYTQRIIFFSFYQAFLSALISCILAIPFALALNRHKDHKLIRYIISLCGFSFVIPSVLIVFSVIKIFGYNGILNKYFNFYDFISIESIYGLKAILIAHVLLNAPFATRLFVQNLNNIPKNYYEISESINLSFFGNIFKLEIPIIRQSLFAVFSIIFSLCFLSFAIVMALGGSPKNSTLEVAIFQYALFDLNFNNLSAGSYELTVSVNGCSSTSATFVIEEPTTTIGTASFTCDRKISLPVTTYFTPTQMAVASPKIKGILYELAVDGTYTATVTTQEFVVSTATSTFNFDFKGITLDEGEKYKIDIYDLFCNNFN